MEDFNNLSQFMVSFNLLSIVFSILIIVAYWKVFEKSGNPGWGILIPFYNLYLKFKVAKKEKWFFIDMIATVFMVIMAVMIAAATGNDTMGSAAFCGFMFFVAIIVMLIAEIQRIFGTAKAFGQSTAFGFGLLFLEPIFVMILAFKSDISYDGSETIASV